MDDNGKLNVGSERGLAFLAHGDTIVEANEKIEAALDAVKGDFHYRSDIGTMELTRYKTQTVNQLRGAEFRVRTAKETDFLDVYEFVSGCPPWKIMPSMYTKFYCATLAIPVLLRKCEIESWDYYKPGRHFMLFEKILPGGEKLNHNGE